MAGEYMAVTKTAKLFLMQGHHILSLQYIQNRIPTRKISFNNKKLQLKGKHSHDFE
jgi:hypothetical protein